MINKRYNKSLSRLADRNKKLRKIKVGVIFALPVLLLVTLTLLSRLSSFQISSVEVSGEESIAKDDIENAALESISGNKFFIFPRTNVFMVNESALASVLLSEFPRIENINVEKNADGVIKVKVKERQAVASWCKDTSCFLLDSTGLVYSPVKSDLELFGKIIFRGGIDGDPLMKNFQTKEIMDSYFKAVSVLKDNNIETTSIEIESRDKGIIKTSIGNIFINPESSELIEAIENAILVIEERKANNSEFVFEYIDVRFGNKVFYK